MGCTESQPSQSDQQVAQHAFSFLDKCTYVGDHIEGIPIRFTVGGHTEALVRRVHFRRRSCLDPSKVPWLQNFRVECGTERWEIVLDPLTCYRARDTEYSQSLVKLKEPLQRHTFEGELDPSVLIVVCCARPGRIEIQRCDDVVLLECYK